METIIPTQPIPDPTPGKDDERSNLWLIGFVALPVGLMVGYTYGWKRKSKENVFQEFKLGTITEEKKSKESKDDWESFLEFPELKKQFSPPPFFFIFFLF